MYIYILCFVFEFCLRIHANNEIQDLQSFLLESTLGALFTVPAAGAPLASEMERSGICVIG